MWAAGVEHGFVGVKNNGMEGGGGQWGEEGGLYKALEKGRRRGFVDIRVSFRLCSTLMVGRREGFGEIGGWANRLVGFFRRREKILRIGLGVVVMQGDRESVLKEMLKKTMDRYRNTGGEGWDKNRGSL